MPYQRLADLVVLIHFAFVLFVVAGGFAVLRRPRLAWLHVPAFLWGVLIEYAGWICPLTPLELELRRRGGQAGYAGGFIDHYVAAILYPAGLSRGAQVLLGTLVLALNLAIYAALWARRRARQAPGPRTPD